MAKNKIDNVCKICGATEHHSGFCYTHYIEIKKLNIKNENIEKIKLILSEKGKLSISSNTNIKPKLGHCKICGQPTNKELCVIHKKINRYLNKK